VLAVPLLVAPVLVVRRLGRRAGRTGGGLSNDERQELLERVRGWLDAETERADEGTHA